MISNTDIINGMQADSLFGVRLDKALRGVKDEVLSQAHRIQLGARRLVFYTSCFTENYQDVCKDQKHEDVRFMEAIGQLVKEHHVVRKMLEIYVNQLLQGLTSERITRIRKILIGMGVTIASGSLTNQALAYSIAMAASYSIGIRMGATRNLAKVSAASITLVSYYGYVQMAADAANRLKNQNPRYYSALYAGKLEMFYFIVEPVISRNAHSINSSRTDKDIADDIVRIIR
ncbi:MULTISPECIES: hypothetical protein [Pantoea]|uniref:hypothetical protein n=1 Tax=Pantoea TaxID=53335 RepID=UPI001B30BACB|nr:MULTISPECIES: hypothetical protein [Pantoea]MDJ0042569.1 hypothetical protein [Pantoea allii]